VGKTCPLGGKKNAFETLKKEKSRDSAERKINEKQEKKWLARSKPKRKSSQDTPPKRIA